jgi:hypothetical protein
MMLSVVPRSDRASVRPYVGALRAASSWSWSGWLVVATAVAASIRLAHGANNVLLDFEGVGNLFPIGSFYGPTVLFGSGAKGAIDGDAPGGSFSIANLPSPSTGLFFTGNETQSFLTVPGGFTSLSFQYTSFDRDVIVIVYAGPNRTGTILGVSLLPAVGACPTDCGDPTGAFGIWLNVTVPFAGGVAQSAGFSTDTAGRALIVDDLILALAPPPPPAPSKRPAKAPTGRPITRPTPLTRPTPTRACRRNMAGRTRRCMK